MIPGDYQIDMVMDGHFWLDAGSIFGVVPQEDSIADCVSARHLWLHNLSST